MPTYLYYTQGIHDFQEELTIRGLPLLWQPPYSVFTARRANLCSGGKALYAFPRHFCHLICCRM